MTLHELHKRIGEVIAEREKEGRGARNDEPVYVSVRVSPRRKWYVPIKYVCGGLLTISDDVHCTEVCGDSLNKIVINV